MRIYVQPWAEAVAEQNGRRGRHFGVSLHSSFQECCEYIDGYFFAQRRSGLLAHDYHAGRPYWADITCDEAGAEVLAAILATKGYRSYNNDITWLRECDNPPADGDF